MVQPIKGLKIQLRFAHEFLCILFRLYKGLYINCRQNQEFFKQSRAKIKYLQLSHTALWKLILKKEQQMWESSSNGDAHHEWHAT